MIWKMSMYPESRGAPLLAVMFGRLGWVELLALLLLSHLSVEKMFSVSIAASSHSGGFYI